MSKQVLLRRDLLLFYRLIMQLNKIRKYVHLLSTSWLIGAFFYVLFSALRYHGVNWWIIFSLSGHWLLLAALAVSLYLFAVYNSLVRNTEIEKEHPLTRTFYYMLLYDAAPLVGALAAMCAITSADSVEQIVSILSIGTFAVTFLFWIIIDPSLNLIEILLPDSRKLRNQRIERTRENKIQHKMSQQQMLQALYEAEQQQKEYWRAKLIPLAEDLNHLFNAGIDRNSQRKIIDIGLKAWQIGGIGGMIELLTIAQKLNGQTERWGTYEKYLSAMWDGIGEWKQRH